MRQLTDPPYLTGLRKLTSFGDVDEVLRSPHFGQGSQAEYGPLFQDVLLMIDGPEHFQRRRMEAQLFSRAALEYYERQALTPVIEQCLHEALDGVTPPVHVDLVPLVRTMMHRISATVTGIDGVDTPERTERFRWFVERLQESVTLGWSTEDQYALMQRGLEVRKQFVVEFLAASVERRRALIADMHAGRITRDDLPRDLLTMMLLHWNDEWDEDLHVREATLYLVASTGTTAQAAPHLLGHLFEWLDAHPEDRLRADDPDFLRRAAAESLRLHLPAPALLRQANTDVTLASGIEVKKGEKVGLIFRGANRDTTVFGADANEFNPWRTVPQSVRGWGLTFGGGEHMCIGRPLVTGLPSTSSESGTDGTLVQIIRSLLRAGARPDPASPAKYTEASHHDAYATFPLFLG